MAGLTPRRVQFWAFKKSGKLAYSGVATLPDNQNYYRSDVELLNDLDRNQTDVATGAISSGMYGVTVIAFDDDGVFINRHINPMK